MKLTLPQIVVTICLPFVIGLVSLTATSCTKDQNGNTTADPAFWTSPATQAEITFLLSIGNDALKSWIDSQTSAHGQPPAAVITTAKARVAKMSPSDKAKLRRAVKSTPSS